MVAFNIKCSSNEEMYELRERIYLALAGSPGYINNEIVLADLQDDAFTIIVGQNNANDIEYDLHSSQLLVRCDQSGSEDNASTADIEPIKAFNG